MTAPLLVAQNLHKAYGDILAVDGLSFQIAPGEIFGLLGPNGAGKTTTIAMVTGLLPPDQGRVIIDGLDLSRNPQAAKARLGLVPQDLALYSTLSARDNLNFFGRIYGLRGKTLRRRVDEVLDIVGLTKRADDPIETYSGGMKRRANIAAGLLHKPRLLFLDEPTVGVDPQSRHAILESIQALNQEGIAVLYTTHYMEEAQRLCHRVAIIDQGRIVAQDSPTALIQQRGSGIILLGLSNGAAPAVAAQIKELPNIQNVTAADDGLLTIQAHRAQEAVIDILETVNRLQASIISLKILEPNLETVFLYLTGKRLRD